MLWHPGAIVARRRRTGRAKRRVLGLLVLRRLRLHREAAAVRAAVRKGSIPCDACGGRSCRRCCGCCGRRRQSELWCSVGRVLRCVMLLLLLLRIGMIKRMLRWQVLLDARWRRRRRAHQLRAVCVRLLLLWWHGRILRLLLLWWQGKIFGLLLRMLRLLLHGDRVSRWKLPVLRLLHRSASCCNLNGLHHHSTCRHRCCACHRKLEA